MEILLYPTSLDQLVEDQSPSARLVPEDRNYHQAGDLTWVMGMSNTSVQHLLNEPCSRLHSLHSNTGHNKAKGIMSSDHQLEQY